MRPNTCVATARNKITVIITTQLLGGAYDFIDHWGGFIYHLREIHWLKQYPSAFINVTILKQISNIFYTPILARLNMINSTDSTEPGNSQSNHVTNKITPKFYEDTPNHFIQDNIINGGQGLNDRTHQGGNFGTFTRLKKDSTIQVFHSNYWYILKETQTILDIYTACQHIFFGILNHHSNRFYPDEGL